MIKFARLLYVSFALLFIIAISFGLKLSYVLKINPLSKLLESILKFILSFSGVVFVKIAQSLSLKRYLIGERLSKSLSSLQEKSFGKQKSFNYIKKFVKQDFQSNNIDIDVIHQKNILNNNQNFYGKPILILQNKKPDFSGSIANIYKCKLISQENKESFVALKIVKIWLKKQTIADLEIFLSIAKFLNYFNKFKKLELPLIIENVSKITINEFDMQMELNNSYLLKSNLVFKENKHQNIFNFRIPIIYDEFSTKSILMQEWIDGLSLINILNKDQMTLDKKVRHKIAKSIILLYLEQVYNDGCFHADLHLGNIIYCKSQECLYLVDCGNVSQISKKDRMAVAKILYFFIAKNYKKATIEYIKAGYISSNVDVNLFSNELQKLATKAIKSNCDSNVMDVSSVINSVIEITQKFNLKVQPQLLMLQKTILYVEASVYQIDSNFDVWSTIIPWMKQWSWNNSTLKQKIKTIFTKLLRKI